MSGILSELQEAGVRVRYGVDATALRKGLKVRCVQRPGYCTFPI